MATLSEAEVFRDMAYEAQKAHIATLEATIQQLQEQVAKVTLQLGHEQVTNRKLAGLVNRGSGFSPLQPERMTYEKQGNKIVPKMVQ